MRTLGRKQSSSHDDFLRTLASIEQIVPYRRYVSLRDKTVAEVRAVVAGRAAGFGWSGGKDALALEAVCRRAGIEECVLGMTDHLEYPAFLRWVTDHMPDGLTVIKNGWNIDWLAAHPEMLFPPDAATAAKWFSGVQHHAQAEFFRLRKLSLILLGRRRSDGNFVGRGGSNLYEAEGVVRYSPLADWTHEDVLAALRYEGWFDPAAGPGGDRMPPFYRWPRGFRCGTHAWPARQWCGSEANGWREVYAIDPDVVRAASLKIAGARAFLTSVGC